MTTNNVNAINKTTITVDVVSDNICPFCFVGKRSLEKAIKESQQQHGSAFDVDVRWHPFQLNENLPLSGVNKREAYIKKMGAERAKKMEPYMINVGRQAGIEFSYGGLIGNTFQSHRLSDWARKMGGSDAQDKVVESLFRGYFEQEKDITDPDFLMEVAEQSGLDRNAARRMLESSDGAAELYSEEQQWRSKHRITSVPFFKINGAEGMSGAQQPETFKEAIESAIQKQRRQEESSTGPKNDVFDSGMHCVDGICALP